MSQEPDQLTQRAGSRSHQGGNDCSPSYACIIPSPGQLQMLQSMGLSLLSPCETIFAAISPYSTCFLFPEPPLTGATLDPKPGLLSPQHSCCFSGTSKPACGSLYLCILPVLRVAQGHSPPQCWEAATPRIPQNHTGHHS